MENDEFMDYLQGQAKLAYLVLVVGSIILFLLFFALYGLLEAIV